MTLKLTNCLWVTVSKKNDILWVNSNCTFFCGWTDISDWITCNEQRNRGEVLGKMEDGNDKMWERFLFLPDMDQDSSVEWSEVPSTTLGGGQEVLDIDAHTCVYTCFEINVMKPCQNGKNVNPFGSWLL